VFIEPDTPFRKLARSLKAPNSPEFDVMVWEEHIKSNSLSQNDLHLCQAAMWIGAESLLLRMHLEDGGAPVLGPQLSTTLAVAMLNRETSILSEKMMKLNRPQGDAPRTIEQLANVTLKSHGGHFDVDVSSHADSIIDAVDSWLFASMNSLEKNQPGKIDLMAAAVFYTQQFSLKRSHYDLWQQALWEDWRFILQEGRTVFVPSKPEIKELAEASLMRQQSKFLSHSMIDLARWTKMSADWRRQMQLPLTVVAVDKRSGQKRRFVVARPSLKRMPSYAFAREGLAAYAGLAIERS